MKFKRAATAAAVTVITAAAVTSCSSAAEPLTYAPAAYGIPGYCYYVDSPAEAVALEAAGLCPASWVPTLMPLAWHEEYYSYYSSSAYYGTYVPARIRTVYVRTETTFGHSNAAVIKTQSGKATYKSSSGTTVKGSKLTGKTRFGSGTSFGTTGQKYGGGSLRSGGSSGSSSSKSGSSKSGSSGSVSSKSGSSRSGSSRSGSLRSGSSGSRSSGSHR